MEGKKESGPSIQPGDTTRSEKKTLKTWRGFMKCILRVFKGCKKKPK
jgi:hypothetical protein